MVEKPPHSPVCLFPKMLIDDPLLGSSVGKTPGVSGVSTSLKFKSLLSESDLSHLVAKYSTAAPRYTSYPTAVDFTSSFGESEWRDQLALDSAARSLASSSKGEISAERSNSAYSLYLHIPFCHALCYFCACNKIVTRERNQIDSYLTAVEREIRSYRLQLEGDVPIEQIHWGGGTPNFLRPDEIRRLHFAYSSAFPDLQPEADVSVEIDPRTVSLEQLRTFKELNFNRISFGVQDFDPEVQRTINRIQSFELTTRVCSDARELGFGGVNIDLIYGLPMQTLQGFEQTVDQVLQIRPDRIALYGYAHVTWIKKVQKSFERARIPTPAERISLFLAAVRKFTEAGYRHIGMDHFALPEDDLARALDDGRLHRNFMGYTSHRGVRLLGFGVSAISTIPRAYSQNTKDLLKYQQGVESQGMAVERGLVCSQDDILRGEIIHDLLCSGVVDRKRLETEWGCCFDKDFAETFLVLEPMRADGLVLITPEEIRITELGRLFARNIASAFDAYLPKHRQSAKPVFSQAV